MNTFLRVEHICYSCPWEHHCWQSQVDMRFLCVRVCVYMCMGAHVQHTLGWSSNERRPWTVLIQGKRPIHGCHGKYAPLSRASGLILPPPPLFTALHCSSPRCFPLHCDFLSAFHFQQILSFLFLAQIQSFSALFNPSPHPHPFFWHPSPIFPSRHSGLPTGSRQAVNTAQEETTFNASWQANWAVPGMATAPRPLLIHAHEPQISTFT